jgi:hypothetical protein
VAIHGDIAANRSQADPATSNRLMADPTGEVLAAVDAIGEGAGHQGRMQVVWRKLRCR